MRIKEIFERQKDMVMEYFEEYGAKVRTHNNIDEFLNYIRDRIINFGYGKTTFHTADIQLLLMICEEAKSKEDAEDTHDD